MSHVEASVTEQLSVYLPPFVSRVVLGQQALDHTDQALDHTDQSAAQTGLNLSRDVFWFVVGAEKS